MKNICSEDKCTGCGLCAAKCPKSAISLELVGLHYRPVIDQKKCVDCNLCQRSCPVNAPLVLNSSEACFAAWSKDDYDHFESASGGIATTLAKTFIAHGGYVAGCAWDKDLRATTIVTNGVNELEKIRKSKYVHNYFAKDAYKAIFDLLKNDKKVLFIGVPCQCAAIKKFTENFTNNLFICDLLCHGAASPKLLQDHIASFHRKGLVFSDITFRGGDYDCNFCLWNDNKELVYKSGQYIDPYFFSFMRHTMYRASCLSCAYAKCERIGDLTLADFWGLDEKIVQKYDLHKKGVNLVLLHTEKGRELLSQIKEKIVIFERNVQEAVNGNDTLKESTHKPFQFDFLNLLFPLIGLKKSVQLFDLIYLKKEIRSIVRRMIPNIIVKQLKRMKP